MATRSAGEVPDCGSYGAAVKDDPYDDMLDEMRDDRGIGIGAFEQDNSGDDGDLNCARIQ